jgi:hypothetical protein
MNKKNPLKSVWATDIQMLLLKAAASEGDQALCCWTNFLSHKPDLTHSTTQQLLPLVYYNLVIQQGFDKFKLQDTLKKHYLICYANNHYTLNSIAGPLNKIQQCGISVMAIKGLAHLLQLYKDKGARVMSDIDLMVSETNFNKTATILEDFGWKTFKCRPLKTYNFRLVHALSYFDSDGNCIDLHSHLLHFDLRQHADENYWKAAEDCLFQNIPIKTLCMTDHFLHVCVHGLTLTDARSSLRWIVDAVFILRKKSIDWNRLIFIAKEKNLSICLFSALSYLATHFSVPIPAMALETLHEIPPARFEQKIFELMHKKTNILKKQQYVFYKIYYNSPSKTWINCIINYLKHVAITDRLLLVPFKLPGRILWKLKRELMLSIRDNTLGSRPK